MMTLAEKCSEAAGNLSRLYGEFTLFSLVQWERSAGKWDVVVSAPWLYLDREGIHRIASGLEQVLSSEDWLEIASIIPFRPEASFVQTMLRIFGSRYMEQVHGFPENLIRESGPFTTQDFQVDRAFAVVANKSPVVMQEHSPGSGMTEKLLQPRVVCGPLDVNKGVTSSNLVLSIFQRLLWE